MWCAADNHNYMCHICAKGFSDSNFNEALIDKISFFHKLLQLSQIQKKKKKKKKSPLSRIIARM